MNQHDKFHRLLNLSAADALEKGEQRRLQSHIDQCSSCRAEYVNWLSLTDVLKKLPAPQASSNLLRKTCRLIVMQMANQREERLNRAILGVLVLLSWIAAILNWFFMRLFDFPLARWLDVSSTTVWIAYVGLTWLVVALAAGLLGKHLHPKGNL